MGGLGVAEDPGFAFGALGRGVPEPVLRFEPDLVQLWESRQQPLPHLVDQVLNRHADEAVEGVADVVGDLLAGDIALAIAGQRRSRLAVAPEDVEVDVQRAVAPLGQGGVAIPGKAGECAAGELHQLQVPAARLELEQPFAGVGQLDGAVVARRRAEQPAAVGAVGQLPVADPQLLHLGIGLQEAPGDEPGKALRGSAAVLESLRVDEVLHRVGRHDLRVVALGVCGPEGVTEDIHGHTAGEQQVVAPAEG